ncbi:MAG: DUF4167 domain-containing protein [Alphaproteobacteria bacterium]|nr:DUF4167 domain-containing protein [Alphaproteobacteria bacterium]
MRSGPNNRRPRGRGNSGRGNNRPQRNNNVDSNGPDVKVRGSAQQVVDKYQALAREATTAGDPVRAENYYQHAEHYYRVLSANAANQEKQQRDNRNDRNNGAAQQNAANGAEANGSNGNNGNNGKGNNGNDAAVVETAVVVPNGDAETKTADSAREPAAADEAIVERIEVVQEPVAEEPEEATPS